jgi:tRNA threonylcarbamoyl adenosine modification protein YjeE
MPAEPSMSAPAPVVLDLDERGLTRLAEVVALQVRPGDLIALRGDLGAGKTTFARALVRAILADPAVDVPSPTFAIEQVYDGRLTVAHYDFYRLTGAADFDQIGFDERLETSLVLVEWPERVYGRLPAERIDLQLDPSPTPDRRRVTIGATGPAAPRLARALTVGAFLDKQPHWASARVEHVFGDASTRAYARLVDGQRTAILMDAPRRPNGPPIRDGKPYSRIAKLAEDVRPFVAVQMGLRQTGLGAPRIIARDLDAGLLILEDLGRNDFGTLVRSGTVDQARLWAAAVDVLIMLREQPFPTTIVLPDATTHTLPRFDRAAFEIEIEQFLDWFWPSAFGAPVSPVIRAEFMTAWSPLIEAMLREPPGIFLRDFHSPNLFWRPDQKGLAKVGLIDFQDALSEPWGYDLVSLLQDARVDVPEDIETIEKARYRAALARLEPTFDAGAFDARYAVFGAERATRLIGLWCRLRDRDGKAQYMAHMPRTWRHLERNLAHPRLAAVRGWMDRHVPRDKRG